jgi:hypothetical protein
MDAELSGLLAPREETVTLGGRTLVVRELVAAADVAAFADSEDVNFKMLVRCVYEEDGSTLAFSDDDIPTLKRAARIRLLPLLEASVRVNGFDVGDREKNSGAGPGAG